MPDETAPPFENWTEHLKALKDRDLAQIAKDYRWLDERSRAVEERAEFHSRREAIIAECERRGMAECALECRGPAVGGGSGA